MYFFSLLGDTDLFIISIKGYVNTDIESKSKIASLRYLKTNIIKLGYFKIKIFFNKIISHHKSSQFLCFVIFLVITKISQPLRMNKANLDKLDEKHELSRSNKASA